MSVAEERHSTVLNASVSAYQQEVESARRDARAAYEVNKSLHDTVLRLQQDRDAEILRLRQGQDAEAARATRLRELEQAFELQANQLLTMQREKENAATAAQAHAAAWSAAHQSDSSGEGNHFHELSSSGAGSQPGGVRNTFGYTKGAHSEQATTCPTAGGYEGSQASFRERELFHIDLTNYNTNPELGVTPDGRAEHSELSDVPASAVAGRPILPASSLPLSVAELSAPQTAQLAQTQTITAPTVAERVNRKPSPNRPAGSSNDGNRKPDKGDKDGKKDDDEGKGDDRDPPKPPRPGIPGGKKDPDDDSPDASPEASLIDEDEEERVAPSKQGRAHQPRCRVADEVKFLGFPLGQQWRAWRTHAISTIISAAGRQDDDAFHWVDKCATQEPHTLQEPGEGWIALDRKIAAGLTRICHGEIGREITQLCNNMYNDKQIVRGRVLLALVFRYYASGNSGQVLYNFNHLQGLKMIGDNIEGFHNTWNMVLSELETRPDEKLLQHLYFTQVCDFKPLEADIAFYKRAQWNGGPEFCFQWLWDSACRYITQLRADYMQHALNKCFTTRHNAAPAPKGKGKEKKGDERKPRSATPNRPPKGGGRGNPKGGTPRGRSADEGGEGRDTPNKSVCYAFQKGTCTRGAACGYPHEKSRERSSSARPKPQQKSTKQCTFFQSGTCKFGENAMTCTVAMTETLPQNGSLRASVKEIESPLRLLWRFRC